jgi:N-acetylglutamate synthase-like GNAT family acetyltransferase
MEIIVRKMQEIDVCQIYDMFDNGDEFKLKWLASKQYLLEESHRKYAYVAEYNGDLAGFIYGDVAFETLLILQLVFVKPNMRKMGIGHLLMNTIETESKCQTSLIYYHHHLHDYYAMLGYEQGEELEVAIKTFTAESGAIE